MNAQKRELAAAKKRIVITLEDKFKLHEMEVEKKQLAMGMLTLPPFKRLKMCSRRNLTQAHLPTKAKIVIVRKKMKVSERK